MNLKKISVIAIIVIFALASYYFGLFDYLELTYIKKHLAAFKNLIDRNPASSAAIFFGIYVLSTALSVPGASLLTLLAGALFGFGQGLIIASFASSIGATLAFLAARFLFRDTVQNKFGDKLKRFNDGVKREGHLYLLSLRLIPLFPFFLVNLVMALTPIKTITYYLTSQIGMLPGTAAYVYAGLSLSSIDSLSGILSTNILLAFAALGVVPIISKMTLAFVRQRKVYSKFKKPKTFEYNLIVIGAGSAGLVSSYIAAAVKAKVLLIERNKMGGDCLNTGCVPSKALIKSAAVVHSRKTAQKFGLRAIEVDFSFAEVMERVQSIIKKIEPHDSVERYQNLGVDCLQGEATIKSPWEVKLNGKLITTKNIIIATGGSPFVPPITGINSINYLTSENLWDLRELPKKFLVLGAGPIGLEMAQSFSRLGSEVTVVEMGHSILSKEDEDVASFVQERLQKEGVKFLFHTKTKELRPGVLIAEYEGEEREIEFDEILIAVGRRANTKSLGLESIDLPLDARGAVSTDEFMRTKYPNILACGDVAGNFQLTHAASHEAWFATVNSLFGRFKKFRRDYSAMPWVTYTSPEVGTVGKNEKMLKAEGQSYEVYKYDIGDLDRAITDGDDYGFVKVMTAPSSSKILGATIVSSKGGEMLMEFTSALKNKLSLDDIMGTIHPYPTMSEGNKYVAGVWKKANAPEKLLDWVKKYHAWERK